jgi:PEP-CTERM motif
MLRNSCAKRARRSHLPLRSAFRVTRFLLALATLGLVSLAGTSAHAVVFTGSGSDADGTLSASATITISGGVITVLLSDTNTGEHSDGQTVSGILFNVSGVTGISNFTQAGSLVNVNGTTVTPVAGSPTHWADSLSSTTLFVDTVPGAGMQPNDLIVGSSPNGNASMASHSPYINGTGTFTLTAAGITDNSIISDVFFQFSTGQDPFVRVPGVAAVPEPATWAMMILGFLGVGLLAYRRKNGTLRLA